MSFAHFLLYLYLSAYEISVKEYLQLKCKYLTFDPILGDRGWGKILITVMFIYRRWIVRAYSKKLSDNYNSFGKM